MPQQSYQVSVIGLANRLIEARDFSDYLIFRESGLANFPEMDRRLPVITDMTNPDSAPNPGKEKYHRGVRAFYEMHILQMIIIKAMSEGIESYNSLSEHGLELVRKAYQQRTPFVPKPHLSLELLKKAWKLNISIEKQELEKIVEAFIFNSACEHYVVGACINRCPYNTPLSENSPREKNMDWTDDYNCPKVYEIARKSLKHHSGADYANQVLSRLSKK